MTVHRDVGFHRETTTARQWNIAFGPTLAAGSVLTSIKVRASFTFAPQDNPATGYNATSVWGHAIQVGVPGTPPTGWWPNSTDTGILAFHDAIPEGFFAVVWAPDTDKAWVTGGWHDQLEWYGQLRQTSSIRLYWTADDVSGAALVYTPAFSWDMWYSA